MRKDAYQNAIRLYARVAMRGDPPMTGPVALNFGFYIRENADKRRGDLTNLQKCAEDALQGIVIGDDRQVVSVESALHLQAETDRTVIEARQVPAATG